MKNGGKRSGAGRKPGSINKTTKILKGLITADFHKTSNERLKQIVEGQLPCQTCRGKLKTPYGLPKGAHEAGCSFHKNIPLQCAKAMLEDDQHRCSKCCSCDGIGMRTCESCYKSGFEQCSPELIGKVAMFLRREVVPDLKAIDHTSSDGSLTRRGDIIRERRMKRNASNAHG